MRVKLARFEAWSAMESEDPMAAIIDSFSTAFVRTITETCKGLGLSQQVCVWVTKYDTSWY